MMWSRERKIDWFSNSRLMALSFAKARSRGHVYKCMEGEGEDSLTGIQPLLKERYAFTFLPSPLLPFSRPID